VLLVGAGSVTPLQLVGALAVLAGVILGLTRGWPRTADLNSSTPEPTEAGADRCRRRGHAPLRPAGVGRFGGTPENAGGRWTADRRSFTAGIGERTR
jgi:hypothetical protein